MTNYNMKPEAFHVDFKELFKDGDLYEGDIAKFIYRPESADKKSL